MIKNENISVIIPVWNGAKTIKRAIKSVLSQTLIPLEILICDDGSTDKTRSCVKSINSPLVKWVEERKHTGKPAVPRNRGLKKAKGKWLAFLDADDEWLCDKLEKQYSALIRTGSLAVCSNAFKIKNDKKKVFFLKTHQKYLTIMDLIRTNPVICSSMLFNRSLLRYAKGFPENGKLISVEDYALWLRIAIQSNILFLNEPLLNYNDNPQTSIRSKVNVNHHLLKILVLKDFLFWWFKNKYENITHR